MIDSIVKTFCHERGISVTDVLGSKRGMEMWLTRYMLWHYLHYEYGMSANALGRMFHRNRPSIFRGIRIIRHQFKYHKGLCDQYHDIVVKLEGMTEATPSGNMEEKD